MERLIQNESVKERNVRLGPGRAGGRPVADRMTSASRASAAFALLGGVQIILIAAITLPVIALPQIQHELGLNHSNLVLISAGYSLSFSGLLLLGGRLADQYGRRQVFVLGITVFGVASGIGGVAPGFEVLVASRFAQGCGAALTAPAAMALLGTVFPDSTQRARAVAVWGSVSGVGAAAGVLLSGVMITWVSWRWSFAIPAVVAVVALFAARWLLPAGPTPRRMRLDIPGGLLVTAGLSVLSLGLLAAGDHSWSSAAVFVPLVGGGALLMAFVAVEARTPIPLLPLSLLASPRRIAALAAVLLTSAGSAGSAFFLPLYFQQVRGLSPAETSAALLPYSLVVLAGWLAGRLAGRIGTRAVTAIGLASASIGLLLLSQVDANTPYAGDLLAGMLVFSAGAGLSFSGATVMAVEGVPEHQSGLAGGIVNTAMEIGPAVGLALLASVAAARTARLSSAGFGSAAAFTDGYAFAMGVAAVVLGLAAGLVIIVSRRQSASSQARPLSTNLSRS